MIRSNNGFTLLEVLVAIAIMGFTMVLVQSTTSQMLDAKDRIEERDLLYQSGRVAMRKLTDDLTQAFLIGKGSTNSNVAFGNPLELPTSPTTITRTVPKPIAFFIGKDGGERDSLKFTSFSHLRFIKDTKESDQAKIEYAMEPSKEDPRIFHLVRKEIPWLDDRTEINTGGLVLVENIREFSVEYYDPRKSEWVREWDSEALDWSGQLPRAVKITLALPDPDDPEQEIEMSTAVLLPLTTPINF